MQPAASLQLKVSTTAIFLAAAAPVLAPAAYTTSPSAATSQHRLALCHSFQQLALLLQRCASQLCSVPCPIRTLSLHCQPVHPALQLLPLLGARSVGAHCRGGLRLGLEREASRKGGVL